MLTIKDPPLAEGRATTYWIGDPAVDLEKSDVVRWAATGDPGALAVRPGQAPAAITWRPLDALELSSLPGHEPGTRTLRMVAAARHGLLEIEGYQLRRQAWHGLSRIVWSQVRALMGQVATFQYGPTLDAWSQADLGVESDPSVQELRGEMALPVWLGATILAASFPRR